MPADLKSTDHHRSAVKFLMNLGTNSNLSKAEQSRLRELMRGPFAKGMREHDAARLLASVKWEDGHE